MKVLRPRVSYTDLAQYPEDGRRYELYDGEVFVVPSPLPRHQIVADNLCDLLRAYAKTAGGIAISSPLDILFSDFDVLQPDVVFFTAARRHLVRPDAPVRHAPDLVVEVLSPSTASTDRGKKAQVFARYGVREYWIVDPAAERIDVYRIGPDGYVLSDSATSPAIARSATLPELDIFTSTLFPRAERA